MENNLWQGDLVRLVALDPDKDPETAAGWTRDSEYLRLLDSDPARPWLAKQSKEEMEKAESKENSVSFLIRALADDRALGFIGIEDIKWTHGDAWVGIGIGNREDWGKGYGTDAMRIAQRYAFTELNLHRLSLNVFEENVRAVKSYSKAGFVVEGRMRQFIHRDGQRTDLIFMGILRSEWEKRRNEPQT